MTLIYHAGVDHLVAEQSAVGRVVSKISAVVNVVNWTRLIPQVHVEGLALFWNWSGKRKGKNRGTHYK